MASFRALYATIHTVVFDEVEEVDDLLVFSKSRLESYIFSFFNDIEKFQKVTSILPFNTIVCLRRLVISMMEIIKSIAKGGRTLLCISTICNRWYGS